LVLKTRAKLAKALRLFRQSISVVATT